MSNYQEKLLEWWEKERKYCEKQLEIAIQNNDSYITDWQNEIDICDKQIQNLKMEKGEGK
jgi:hypothetical protein